MKSISTKIISITALIGILDAGYLTFVKLTKVPIYCTPGLGDCATVNASRWSTILGIPLSLYGLLTYLVLLLLVLYGEKVKFIEPYKEILIFGIALFGFLFSIYLTYLELFVIRATCQWCMLSFAALTIIFISSIFHLVSNNQQKV